MTLNSIKQVVDSEIEGKTRTFMFFKNRSQNSTTNIWNDLSMTAGNPTPKYWFDAPPAIAKVCSQSLDGGLFHGANVSPLTKYLRSTTFYTPSATPSFINVNICDYLLYYPTIDESVLDVQPFDNTATLTRYTDGKGVQVIAVGVATGNATGIFYFTYTNSDGISGRVSQTVKINGVGFTGAIATSSQAALQGSGNPYIGLQDGDTGVRSIESVTMLTEDIGLFSLILVKPLASAFLYQQTAPAHKDFILEGASLPIIQDDAFLGILYNSVGSLLSAPLIGDLKVIWN